MSSIGCSGLCLTHTILDFPELQSILPEVYGVIVCTYTSHGNGMFDTVFRLPITNKEQALKWKDDFEEKTKSTYRKAQTFPGYGKIVAFRGNFVCQHSKQVWKGKKPTSKKMGCVSRIDIQVRVIPSNKYQSIKDKHLPQHPMTVKLSWCHNHLLDTAEALRHRDVALSTKIRIQQLLDEGHSANSAYEKMQKRLKKVEGDNFAVAMADRSKMPEKQYFYRQYYKTCGKLHGKYAGPLCYGDLERNLWQLCQQKAIKCDIFCDGTDFIAAFLPPLMERVHHLVPQSAEMAFIDSSGYMDRYHFRVYILLSTSQVGGLPLGFFISNSESSNAISSGLAMLVTLCGDRAFFGRGRRGPAIFITDNCAAQKQAIASVFPEARHLFCIFHILQACWHYLWSTDSGTMADDRPVIYNVMKGLVYSRTEEELVGIWNAAVGDRAFFENGKATEYLKDLMTQRHMWSLAYRADLITRDENTKSMSETSFKILKSAILKRQKYCNAVHLVQILTTKMPKYFCNQIISKIISSEVAPSSNASSVSKKALRYKKTDIVPLDVETFSIRSGPNVYCVNSHIGCCTCPTGRSGAICTHQLTVNNFYPRQEAPKMPLQGEEERLLYMEVATGSRFNGLSEQAVVSEDSEDSDSTESDTDTASEGELSRPGYGQDSIDMEYEEDNDGSQNVAHLIEMWKKLSEDIEERVKRNPQTLAEPMRKSLENLQKCQTDLMLADALATFGKINSHKGLGRDMKVRPKALMKKKYRTQGSWASASHYQKAAFVKSKTN